MLVERFPSMVDSLPEVVAHHFTEAGLAADAIGYWLKAGQLASTRSANREALKSFEQALTVLEVLPESPSTVEQAFEIRLELRRALIQLGEVRRVLDRLREAETLAEKLNDDRRRGRVCAFMTNVHGQLGELDEAVASGSRALAIARMLEDLELRILTTTYLEMVHYYRGEYERVIELATDNLAELPADWAYKHFGNAAPASVFDRHCLVMSLAQLGRFAEAAEYETEAIRLAEPTHHAFTVALAHFPSHTLHPLKGDWATARALLEHEIAMLRTGNIVLLLPTAVASSAWVLAQLGEASEALNRFHEGERLVEHEASRGVHPLSRLGLPLRWVAPVCCSAGWTRRRGLAAARSSAPGLSPGSRPMRYTCWATSRPIPTGSTPRAARPTTARPWPSPSRAACAPSSPTATSASAGSTCGPASASRDASTSPPPPLCTARWTCDTGWPTRRRSCVSRYRRGARSATSAFGR